LIPEVAEEDKGASERVRENMNNEMTDKKVRKRGGEGVEGKVSGREKERERKSDRQTD
jgi:hypothetical protein